MKWTIVGTGWISESFIQSLINNNQEIYGVVTRNKENAKEFIKKYSIKKVFTSIDEDIDSECVYIGTPNVFHFDIAKKAIMMKKNVMVEKPMTHKPKYTEQLFELADAYNVKIMEAYAHITQPFFQNKIEVRTNLDLNYCQLSSKIKDNTFNEASSFKKEYFGGVVADLGVYTFSIAVLLNGKVKNIKVDNCNFINGCIVECDIELMHINGKRTNIKLSKLKDDDNGVYVDSKRILDHLNFTNLENKMDSEIRIFLSGDNLDKYRNISIQVSKIVDQVHKLVY